MSNIRRDQNIMDKTSETVERMLNCILTSSDESDDMEQALTKGTIKKLRECKATNENPKEGIEYEFIPGTTVNMNKEKSYVAQQLERINKEYPIYIINEDKPPPINFFDHTWAPLNTKVDTDAEFRAKMYAALNNNISQSPNRLEKISDNGLTIIEADEVKKNSDRTSLKSDPKSETDLLLSNTPSSSIMSLTSSSSSACTVYSFNSDSASSSTGTFETAIPNYIIETSSSSTSMETIGFNNEGIENITNENTDYTVNRNVCMEESSEVRNNDKNPLSSDDDNAKMQI